MQLVIGVILLLISALMSVMISIYFVIYGKKSNLLNSFVWCQILVFIWSVGHILEITTMSLDIKWYAVCFENVGICFIGFVWLLFSLQYTGSRFIEKPKRMIILFIIPSVMFSFFLTNNYHKMVYSVLELDDIEFGNIFWIHILFVYVYVFIGTLLIIKHALKMIGKERKQSMLMIFAVTVPFLCNILHVFGVVRFKFDITPISFSLSSFLFAIATFKYSFLNTIPEGLHKVFDTVDSAIMLIDNQGIIISCNNAFNKIFKGYESNNTLEFQSFLEEKTLYDTDNKMLRKAIIKGSMEPVFGEMKYEDSNILRVAVQPIFDGRRKTIGRVISFTDITSYRELTDELEKKNLQLIEANEQLREHMLAVEELAVIKERNRVARDIHDTLGHTLTFLTKIQESAILDLGVDNEKTREAMKKANEITRQGLKELRLSIYDLMPNRIESGVLMVDLERLSKSFKSSGVDIEVMVDGNTDYTSPVYSQTVFRVCQEAVTNSLKHGNANEIHIMLRFVKKSIDLFIIDNGTGCKEIKKGYGLSGMEERITKLNGNIIFGSDGESGFNIHAEIPLRGEC